VLRCQVPGTDRASGVPGGLAAGTRVRRTPFSARLRWCRSCRAWSHLHSARARLLLVAVGATFLARGSARCQDPATGAVFPGTGHPEIRRHRHRIHRPSGIGRPPQHSRVNSHAAQPPRREPAGQPVASSPTWPIARVLANHWPTLPSIGQHCHGTARDSKKSSKRSWSGKPVSGPDQLHRPGGYRR